VADVSIIIPTHNRPQELRRAVDSVLNQQTRRQLEVLIVGDDTDPESAAYATSLAEQPYHGLRGDTVRFWNLPKQPFEATPWDSWNTVGLTARNWGHDHATGTYVGGLDDDDTYTLDHVEVLARAIEIMDVDFAYGKSEAIGHDGSRGMYGKWPPGFAAFCDGAALWKRSLGYRYDPECVTRGLPEDGALWLRMIEGKVKFFFVDQVVHTYHVSLREWGREIPGFEEYTGKNE
jgi:glycosyltransferase involved in cell wall biosynthesis